MTQKIKQKTNMIGFKDLREHAEKYIKQVEKGQSFTVLRRSKPIFKISPVETEDVWESIIDFTELDPEGVSASEILKKLKKING